jgi:hypothetical protein
VPPQAEHEHARDRLGAYALVAAQLRLDLRGAKAGARVRCLRVRGVRVRVRGVRVRGVRVGVRGVRVGVSRGGEGGREGEASAEAVRV